MLLSCCRRKRHDRIWEQDMRVIQSGSLTGNEKEIGSFLVQREMSEGIHCVGDESVFV